MAKKLVALALAALLSATMLASDAAIDPTAADEQSAPASSEAAPSISKPVYDKSGVYDGSGKRIFYIEDGQLFDDAGHSYAYDTKWERVTRDGAVVMDYNFNKRQWEWIEDVPRTTSWPLADRVSKESVRRIYKKDGPVLTTTVQGSYPILSFKDGNYVNEFGEPVYSLIGGLPNWSSIILLHHYYQEVYESDAIEEITARRAVATDLFANSSSLANEIFAWGEDYASRRKKKIMYVTSIDGEIFVLNDAQIKRIKNGWLILNKKPLLGSGSTVVIPEASFFLSKRKAKKAGVQGIESNSVILELKARPEYTADLRAALSPENGV